MAVFGQRVNREAIRIEELTDIPGHIEHDLVDVGRRVDAVGDRLQLLGERQFRRHIRDICSPTGFGFQYRTHLTTPSFLMGRRR